MKYVKTFEGYQNNIEHYNYIDIEKVKNGLKLILNSEGREVLEDTSEDDIKSENIMDEIFDDVQGNSEYNFIHDLGDMGFGLTSAPGISDGYFYNDDNEYVAHDSKEMPAEVYFYDDYMITNFIEILLAEGEVIFTKA